MVDITHSMLKKLLNSYYEAGQPVFITGPTGIGKSVSAREFFEWKAKQMNLDFKEWNSISAAEKLTYLHDDKKREKTMLFVDERVNLKDTTDNKGIPNLTKDEYLQWVKTLIIQIATRENAHVIFFKDEMNQASVSVMNSEFQWILDKAIDDVTFAKNVYTLAAGNRLEDQAQVSEISAPLKNRFAHVTLLCSSLEGWTIWAADHGVISSIISFLHFRESYLFMYKEDLKDSAFGTPRMWFKLSNLIKDIKDIDIIKTLSQSMVGDAAGHEYAKFVELEMSIDLDDFLKNPKKLAEIPANKMDIKHAILSSAIDRYRRDPDVLKQAVMFIKYMAPQFSIYFLKMLSVTNKKYFRANVVKTPVWDEIRDNYGKYLLEE